MGFAMYKVIIRLFVFIGVFGLYSAVSQAEVKTEQDAVSALCKKLMYKSCNPERDQQLQRYLGSVDVQSIEKNLEGFAGQAPAFTALPKDKNGFVDWSVSVSENIIQPRGSIMGDGDDSEHEKYLENLIVLKTKMDVIPDVVFPHGVHTYWLSCESCHPSPFQEAKGGNNFTMGDIIDGKFCGKCHGKVSFSPQSFKNCSRCHALKKTTAIPPWGAF